MIANPPLPVSPLSRISVMIDSSFTAPPSPYGKTRSPKSNTMSLGTEKSNTSTISKPRCCRVPSERGSPKSSIITLPVALNAVRTRSVGETWFTQSVRSSTSADWPVPVFERGKASPGETLSRKILLYTTFTSPSPSGSSTIGPLYIGCLFQ